MYLACLFFLLCGGWLANRSARRASAALEVAAGILIIGGLVLLGYQFHNIISTQF